MVILGDAQLEGGGTYDFAALGRAMAMIVSSETLAATKRAAIPPTACRDGLGMVEEKIQKRFF